MVDMPQEWTAYPPDSDSGNWEIEDEYGHTATVYGEGEMAKSIAMLIAAAPELLEALKLLLFQGGENYACYCNDPDYQFNSGRDKCDNCIAASAIAKAEGRG